MKSIIECFKVWKCYIKYGKSKGLIHFYFWTILSNPSRIEQIENKLKAINNLY